MSNPSAFVARARKVLAEATPGPLVATQHGEVRAVALDRLSIGFYSQSLSAGRNGSYVVTPEQAKTNAAASALAVNALPSLLDVVEAADALLWYHDECGMESGHGDVLRKALARLEVPE